MFCNNCGHKMTESADFCSECGARNVNKFNDNSNQETLAQQLSKKNPLTPLWKKLKVIFNDGLKFVVKHKKPFIISASTCLTLLLGLFLFNNLYDFTKLSWDSECNDCNISYTESKTLNLKVLAYDKNNQEIKNIKFSTESGEIETNENSVVWKLPDEQGTYKITASAPSGKKITKSIELIEIKDDMLKGLITNKSEDPNLDSDNDGIIDTEEAKLGTNPNLIDSDFDGLSDYYEINISKTDPLKADTDDDGLNDGNELELGLDPLKADSNGDGHKDGDRNLVYTLNNESNNIVVEINCTGNVASTTAEVFNNSTLKSMDGVLGKLYSFNTDGKLESAKVTIKYNTDELLENNIDENNLSLYYFDLENKTFEMVPTEIDINNKTMISNLNHFSSYVVADKTKINTNQVVDIMFIIDNSVSMYTEKQMINRGYNSSTGAVGNDETFKRLTLSNKLVDMFTGNYKFGVAEFSGDYANLVSFSNNKNDIKDAISLMEKEFNTNLDGTNIINALKKGINEFANDYDGHYVILLTDGNNTEGNLSFSKNSIIQSAKDKNVRICIIGLGNNIDTNDLNDIATETGCKLYSAAKDDSLDEIYSLVASDINYNLFDTNADLKTDSILLEDSGFIVTRDGFSFNNFGTKQSSGGNCYGLSLLANLYYRNELPSTLGELSKSHSTGSLKSNGYNLSGTNLYNHSINLYDFNWKSEVLDIYFNKPSDYWGDIKDNTLYINSKYYEMFEKNGIKVELIDYSSNNFNKYQRALIDIDSSTLKNNITNEEYEVLQTIWRLYVQQTDAQNYSFSSGGFFGNNSDWLELKSEDLAFNKLQTSLYYNNPVIINIHANNFDHAVNATKLFVDANDNNKYKVEIYDNRFHGETRYINLTRKKQSVEWYTYISGLFVGNASDYQYSFTYDIDDDGKYDEVEISFSIPTIE